MHALDPVIEFGDLSACIRQQDALAALRELPDQSVDLILTSPPYCIGKEYENSVTVDEFRDEVVRVSNELDRVLRSGGSLCWQVGYHVVNNRVTPLDFEIHSAMATVSSVTLRNRLIWHFGHGTHSQRRFSGRHETVLWYTKGDSYYFDLDGVRVPQKYPGKRHYKGPRKGEFSGNPLGKNPEDVWLIPNVNARHPEKTDHPCQFPVALAQRLIVALSPKGGLVLDPYAGSGTTAVASLLSGRNFVGSELDETYVAIIRNRLIELKSGTLRVRADTPVREPNAREAVARRPSHFRDFGGKNGQAGS